MHHCILNFKLKNRTTYGRVTQRAKYGRYVEFEITIVHRTTCGSRKNTTYNGSLYDEAEVSLMMIGPLWFRTLYY
jgi:hypothetical protein